MSFLATNGKRIVNGTFNLVNGTLSGNLILATILGEYIDIYSIVITSNDPTAATITLGDGTTTLTYQGVGGSAANPPIVDQAQVPVRFKPGTNLTATASAVSAGKTVSVNVRGLITKT